MSALKPPSVQPLARKGEIITCEAGHELYRLRVGLYPRSGLSASAFEVIDAEHAHRPKAGGRFEPRCKCGKPWYRAPWGIVPGAIHFADGWRSPK